MLNRTAFIRRWLSCLVWFLFTEGVHCCSNRFEDFYSLLDDFFNDMTPRRQWRDSFRLDVREDEKEYCIEAELPGVKKEDICLEAVHERLRIAVKREETIDETKGNVIHRERRFGSMERSVHLAAMDEEQVSARFENGILSIPEKIWVSKAETFRLNRTGSTARCAPLLFFFFLAIWHPLVFSN